MKKWLVYEFVEVFDSEEEAKISVREQNYIMVSKKIYDYKKVGDTFNKEDCEN